MGRDGEEFVYTLCSFAAIDYLVSVLGGVRAVGGLGSPKFARGNCLNPSPMFLSHIPF